MEIKKIAVIGAGVMGADVAFDLASHGYDVILKDIDDDRLDEAREKIRKGFRGYRMVKAELKDSSPEAILNKIHFTGSYEDFLDVDLVIENVPEDWEIKKSVYTEVREVCRPSTFYAVNTSCISITKIANLMPRPELVLGMHFMNPVPMKNLVEVIRGLHTAEETIATMKAFLKTLNKNAVVVMDFPGFVSNRLSHLFMNEAAFLVQDQVASPKDIDKIFKQGYGHDMGPLETADLIGLDTVVNSLRILYESYEDPKFKCCPLLKKMVDAGYCGKKSGRGFYEYT
ncbi:MAG TPA: 3-hydroxyacyl-CoA dehydrogenase family protein [Chitinophagaceae bacterium]|nr:3-hydroxyacyl-CoA dehydrogenase family protein [Chitinophagaceae bacterium]